MAVAVKGASFDREELRGDQQGVFCPDLVEGSNNRGSTHAAWSVLECVEKKKLLFEKASLVYDTNREEETWAECNNVEGLVPECVEKKVPANFKVYKQNRGGMEFWEECRDACNEDSQCNLLQVEGQQKIFFYFKSLTFSFC